MPKKKAKPIKDPRSLRIRATSSCEALHACPGNWVAIRCAVVYYARAAHVFSAEVNVGTVHKLENKCMFEGGLI